MPDAELHPVLKDALSQPGDPDAIPVEKQSPEQAREEFESDLAAVDAPAPEMETRELEIPGPARAMGARLYMPSGVDAPAPLLVFFHGGGNIRGSLATHDSTCRVLAQEGGFRVLSVDYRLAPEHPFPAAAEDAMAATVWAHANAGDLGGDPARFAVGGDSAGGNLAAVVALRARDEGGPAIGAQMLIYPVIDHAADTPSRRTYSKGYMLDSMPFYTRAYLPDESARRHPHASPLHAADFSRLPPAVLLTAGHDPLHDEDVAYGERLSAAGVRVERIDYPEMIHGFTLLRGLLGEADEALARCARTAREFLP